MADLKLTEKRGNWLKRTSGNISGFDQKCSRFCQLFSVSVIENDTSRKKNVKKKLAEIYFSKVRKTNLG